MGKPFDVEDMMAAQRKSPCYGCESGWANATQYTDRETGRLMQVNETCFDACEKRLTGIESHAAIWREMARR